MTVSRAYCSRQSTKNYWLTVCCCKSYMLNCSYSKTNQMHQCIKFILTLHVSDRLSVHHQQFKTLHTATGICQTDTAVCLLASGQLYLFVAVCTVLNC